MRTRPILKWAGGKFRLLDAIIPALGPGTRLVEPFVGSGAVFLNCSHKAAFLCDNNPDLIDFFIRLGEGGDAFIAHCRALFRNGNNPDGYYARRERFNALPQSPERAALFLYLNRHGYNGLVRYNARRGFNVPFGRYKRPYFPEAEMRAFLDKIQRTRLTFAEADFRATFKKLRQGDVVYCDPPYAPLSATANFTSYSGTVFGLEEQRELARLAEAAGRRGIRVIVSNHDLPLTRTLYANADALHTFAVRRCISRRGDGRGKVGELLAVYGDGAGGTILPRSRRGRGSE
ncbi:MAG: Dam family site-specific DNA-(adenine-N6)-methyltransferase [Planctomycetaceae bacterium]|nr:Dam family site-specific DNA-(adenine-N6)-methyltransferase [Planctomycetaceae bacterium]